MKPTGLKLSGNLNCSAQLPKLVYSVIEHGTKFRKKTIRSLQQGDTRKSTTDCSDAISTRGERGIRDREFDAFGIRCAAVDIRSLFVTGHTERVRGFRSGIYQFTFFLTGEMARLLKSQPGAYQSTLGDLK